MGLQPFVRPWSLLQFRNLLYTDGRTPWTSDQPVPRPLPTHRTTQTQNKRTHKHPCLELDWNPWSQRSSEGKKFHFSPVLIILGPTLFKHLSFEAIYEYCHLIYFKPRVYWEYVTFVWGNNDFNKVVDVHAIHMSHILHGVFMKV
jgi:hypothetical protein